jgi:hypothetical protein
MKVLFSPEVEDNLFELTNILYEKHYFSFKEPAIMYVVDLECDIKNTLPNRQKRIAPSYFQRYGKNLFYSTFRKSKHTQWYVFFNIYEEKGKLMYLVRYITNNHVIAKDL